MHYQIILKYETRINILQSYNIDTNTIVDEIKFVKNISMNICIVNLELKQFRIIYSDEILNYQLNSKNGKFILISKSKNIEKCTTTKIFPKFGLNIDMKIDSCDFWIYLRDHFHLHRKKSHTFDTLKLHPKDKIFFISDSQFIIFAFKKSNTHRNNYIFKHAIIYGIEIDNKHGRMKNNYRIKKQYDISKYITTYYLNNFSNIYNRIANIIIMKDCELIFQERLNFKSKFLLEQIDSNSLLSEIYKRNV